MATAVFGSAHRAAPDQPRGCAEIRRFVGTVAAIEEPDTPSRDDASKRQIHLLGGPVLC
jgi:hypothetical protein